MNVGQSAPKSWGDRPEGKFAKFFTPLVLIGGGIALFMFWGAIVPWLLMVVADTLLLSLAGLALGAIVFCFVNEKMRTLIAYMYKSLMRFIVGRFIELDPIGIMKGFISDLLKHLEEVRDKRHKLDGQIEALNNQVEANKTEFEHCMKQAKAAQGKPELHEAYMLASRQAGRLKDANAQFSKLSTEMNAFSQVLARVEKTCDFTVKDLQQTVDIESKKRKMMLAGFNAYKAARQIMAGGGTAREMFDDALAFTVEDYGQKMGEIKSFVQDSEGILQGVDLQNGVYAQDAAELLSKWDQKSTELLVRVDTSAAPINTASPGLGAPPPGREFDTLPADGGWFGDQSQGQQKNVRR